MIINFNKKFLNKNYIEKVENAYNYALKLLKVKCRDLEVNISFVSVKESRDLNNNRENGCIFLGDICICKKVAFKQAKKYGNTKLREIVYMAVHGLLHLLGYDHMKDEDKKVMREVEEKIMSFINLTREER